MGVWVLLRGIHWQVFIQNNPVWGLELLVATMIIVVRSKLWSHIYFSSLCNRIKFFCFCFICLYSQTNLCSCLQPLHEWMSSLFFSNPQKNRLRLRQKIVAMCWVLMGVRVLSREVFSWTLPPLCYGRGTEGIHWLTGLRWKEPELLALCSVPRVLEHTTIVRAGRLTHIWTHMKANVLHIQRHTYSKLSKKLKLLRKLRTVCSINVLLTIMKTMKHILVIDIHFEGNLYFVVF